MNKFCSHFIWSCNKLWVEEGGLEVEMEVGTHKDCSHFSLLFFTPIFIYFFAPVIRSCIKEALGGGRWTGGGDEAHKEGGTQASSIQLPVYLLPFVFVPFSFVPSFIYSNFHSFPFYLLPFVFAPIFIWSCFGSHFYLLLNYLLSFYLLPVFWLPINLLPFYLLKFSS